MNTKVIYKLINEVAILNVKANYLLHFYKKIHVYMYPAIKYTLNCMVWEKPMVRKVQLS